MYKMKEFAAMTGMSQSKIRFYEKQGLQLSNRERNGYRMFSPEDAFRSNAFRVLLLYGFNIDEAITLLNAKQGTRKFERSLQEQQEKLHREADLITYRLSRLEAVLEIINSEPYSDFELMDVPDQLYINASCGRDFSVSLEHEKTIAEYYDLLSVTSCARIIRKEDLLGTTATVDPDYIVTMPEYEKSRLSPSAFKQAKHLCLGKCIRFKRQATRTESVEKKAFGALFAYLENHGYAIRSDIILFPSFLNLDGKGSDIEILYVPVQ